MQAIQTKFHGPTNTRNSRISAACDVKRITVDYDHRLGVEGNHAAAAKVLALKLGWEGEWVGGSLPGRGYAFVWPETSDGKMRPSFVVEVAPVDA